MRETATVPFRSLIGYGGGDRVIVVNNDTGVSNLYNGQHAES